VHELSIAQAVVQIASDHAGGCRVEKVELRVGHLRQVVPSALEFAFELLTSGTPLAGAELAIEPVPARGRCRACAVETVMTEFPLQCSRCGGLDMEIVAGEELRVDAIELAQDEELTTEGMAHGC
jgi:hydrogenase nickel incorporation protein HypA/HybF